MSFDDQTNFNQFKRAIFDNREEFEMIDKSDFNMLAFGVVVGRNNRLPLNGDTFDTVMNEYFSHNDKMLCLFGWQPVEVRINKVYVSTHEAGVLTIDFESDLANDYLVCELEIKHNDTYIFYNNYIVETTTFNLSDEEKVSPSLLRELRIGNEYRVRFGARNDLFPTLKWCQWSNWCKMRDVSGDIWKHLLDCHHTTTKHAMSQALQGDENPVKVEIANVTDIFIWGLKRSHHPNNRYQKNQKNGYFFLNIYGSQDNIPLTPVGDDEKCCVYHTQLVLNENKEKGERIIFSNIIN